MMRGKIKAHAFYTNSKKAMPLSESVETEVRKRLEKRRAQTLMCLQRTDLDQLKVTALAR